MRENVTTIHLLIKNVIKTNIKNIFFYCHQHYSESATIASLAVNTKPQRFNENVVGLKYPKPTVMSDDNIFILTKSPEMYNKTEINSLKQNIRYNNI